MSSVAPIATMSLKGFKRTIPTGHLVRYAAQRPKEFCHPQVPNLKAQASIAPITAAMVGSGTTTGISHETTLSMAGLSTG